MFESQPVRGAAHVGRDAITFVEQVGVPHSSEPDVAALLVALARFHETAADDVDRISRLDALERIKAACAAAQARITAEFVDSQAHVARRHWERAAQCSREGDFDGWVVARDAARRAEFEPHIPASTSRGRPHVGGRVRGEASRTEAGSGAVQRASGRSGSQPGSAITTQVGLARHESPARARRIVSTSLALVRHLPHTLAAMAGGVLNERRAEIVARGTSHLSPELRTAVDLEVIGAHPGTCGTWGDRELEHRVRACADRLDARAAVERARIAEGERRVTMRPLPDTMALVSAVLPVAQGVAVHAALTAAAAQAKAAGDSRTSGQVMADTLTERVTGQAAAEDVNVEVQLVMTERTLLRGDDTPARVSGYGPVPAAWARDLLIRDLGAADRVDSDLVVANPPGGPPAEGSLGTSSISPSSTSPPGPGSRVAARAHPRGAPRSREARVWLRRLFTHPGTGTLVAMESTRRLFPAGLRRFLVARDGVCRTPWCDAPIRHMDHVAPWAEGGATSDTNGAGLCVTCNLVKEAPGWRHEVDEPGPTRGGVTPHRIRVTTPTGHTHWSLAPPVLPGVVELPASRTRSQSVLESALMARVAS